MKKRVKDQQQPRTPQEGKGVSRRSFLAGSGGATVALAATGLLGATSVAGAQSPQSAVDHVNEEPPIPDKVPPPAKTEYTCDVVVVGGGFAGLMAAVTAREAGQSVVLIDKGRPGYSGVSPFPRSHLFFDAEMGDNADYFREQMMRGGQYLGNMNWVDIWIKESKAAYLKLKELGIMDTYERAADTGHAARLDFVGYREKYAKHDRHVRFKQSLDERGVEVCEHTMAMNVVKQGDKVVGVIGFHVPSGAIITCHAKATILCMGKGVYKSTGWPTSGLSHDGIFIGYNLGLPIIGQEYEDFHSGNSNEAANGWTPNAWQWLENFWVNGGSWTKDSPKAMIAESANYTIRKLTGVLEGISPGGGFWGSTPVPAAQAAASDGTSHPTVMGMGASLSGRADDVRNVGIRTSTSPIPRGGASYGAASGFSMHLTDGVFCGLDDTVGYTGIPGLWVAGDGICGGAVTGATYAGGHGFTSNFVAIQGKRSAQAATKYAKTVQLEKISSAAIASETERIMAPTKLKQGFSANWALDCLQGIMAPSWTLIIKSKNRLNAALEQIIYMRDKVVPMLQAVNPHDLRYCHEMRHKVLEAEMKLRSSLAREETRGAHYREDFPFRDDKNFLCYIGVKKGANGEMTVSKIPIKDEWKGDLKEDFATRYGNTFYPGEVEALHLNVPKKS